MPKIAAQIAKIVTVFIALAIFSLTITTNSAFATTTVPNPPPIEITEIFPNPKGKDKGNEWVELYNNSEETVDLFGWKLSNGSKKISTIKNSLIIRPQSYFTLEKENLKLALKNTDGQLKLIDTNGQTVDETTYGKAQEDKSFSRILIKSKSSNKSQSTTRTNWRWTTPSKNQSNQSFYVLKGAVQSVSLGGQKGSTDSTITLLIEDKPLTVRLTDKTNQLLIKTILKPDTMVRVLVDKKPNLLDYKILSPPGPANTKPYPEKWLYPYTALLIVLAAILLRTLLKIMPGPPTTAPSPSSHCKSSGQFHHD